MSSGWPAHRRWGDINIITIYMLSFARPVLVGLHENDQTEVYGPALTLREVRVPLPALLEFVSLDTLESDGSETAHPLAKVAILTSGLSGPTAHLNHRRPTSPITRLSSLAALCPPPPRFRGKR